MTTTLERPEAAAPLPDLGPPAHGRRGLGGWATRWRTALRIAWRNARRNRLSTAIATTMIALPVAAAVFLLSFLVSTTGTPLDWYHASYGTNTQAYLYDIGCNGCEMPQRPAPYDPAVAEAGYVPPPGLGRPPTTEDIEAVRPGIDIVEGVGGVVTVTSESGEVDLGRRRAAALPVERLGEVYTARTGRLPAGPTEAALHWQEAERLGVEEGDVVMVDDVPLLVTGVLDSRNRPSASIVTVTGALDLASSGWYVLGETPVTWDDVDALNTIGLRVESPETVTNPNPDGVAYETGGADLQVIGVGAAVAAIALIEAVLLVGPAFAVSARRQTRQLALLVAAGGSRRDARRVVVASGVVIGIVAALAGAVVGLGAVLAMWWVQSRTWTPLVGLRAPWWAIAGPMAFAVVLGLLASLVPARTVARLDVTAALAGRRAEARPRRGVPWVGVGLGVAGLVVAVVGAIGGQMLLVVCGIVALELGTVLAVGGILSLGARLGPRFGVAGRFAVRDAVRQRSRTVPAVASVAAAVAAVVAGAVYVSTDAEMQRAMWQPGIGVGTIRIESASPFLPDEGEPTDMEATAEESIVNAVPLIEEQVPLEGWAYLRAVRTGDWYEDLGGTASNMTVRPALRPDQECPDDMFDSESEDPRCHWRYQDTSFQGLYSEEGVLVDDGSAISLLTAPGADEAAAALAAGSVVVPDPDYIWEDGTVHLEIARFDPIDEKLRTGGRDPRPARARLGAQRRAGDPAAVGGRVGGPGDHAGRRRGATGRAVLDRLGGPRAWRACAGVGARSGPVHLLGRHDDRRDRGRRGHRGPGSDLAERGVGRRGDAPGPGDLRRGRRGAAPHPAGGGGAGGGRRRAGCRARCAAGSHARLGARHRHDRDQLVPEHDRGRRWNGSRRHRALAVGAPHRAGAAGARGGGGVADGSAAAAPGPPDRPVARSVGWGVLPDNGVDSVLHGRAVHSGIRRTGRAVLRGADRTAAQW